MIIYFCLPQVLQKDLWVWFYMPPVLSTERHDENSFYQQFEKDPIVKLWLLWQKTDLKIFLFFDENYLLHEEYQNILYLSDSKKQ